MNGTEKIEEYDVLIIGAGPAGLTCYSHLLRLGIDKNKIRIIEKSDKIGGRLNFFRNIYGVNKGNSATNTDIFIESNYQGIIDQNDIINAEVSTIDKQNGLFVVTCKNDKESKFKTRFLVVACGTIPKPLLNTEISFLNYDQQDYCEKEVAIIGGGYSAHEIAENILNKSKKITIFEKGSKINVTKYRQDKLFQTSNEIVYSLDSNIEDIAKTDNKYTITNNGCSLVFDIVINCTGEIPNTGFIKNSELKYVLDNDYKIIINDFENHFNVNMSRFCENLFAIGDVTNRPLTGFIRFVEGQAIRVALTINNIINK